VTDFKIGDKVKIKKLSEKEFEEIYIKKYHCREYPSLKLYRRYLQDYSKNFDNVYTIRKMNKNEENYIDLIEINPAFYPEELIKVNTLKIRLQLIRELIK
jgi:hypothetical protein